MVAQIQASYAGEDIRILLVGDDPTTREEISGHLRAEVHNLQILPVASVDVLENLSDPLPCDLCVLATRTPAECLDVVDRIHRRRPDCPLLLLLDMEDEQVAAEATRRGADRYIIRTPYYGPRLRAAVSDVIGSPGRHREAVDSLRPNAQQFRDLVESAAQGMLVEVDEKLVYANAALAAILGCDGPEELLNRESIYRFVDQRDLGRVLRISEQRRSGLDAPDAYVFRARRKDGRLIWIENRVSALKWEGRRALQCTMVDVSDRRRANNALRLAARVASRAGQQEDFETAIRVVLRRLARGMGWDVAESWLPSASGDVLEPGPAWCRDYDRCGGFVTMSGDVRFGPGEESVGRAWSSGRPEWIPDIAASAGTARRSVAAGEAGLKAGCAIPVLAHGRTVAVLCFLMGAAQSESRSLINALAAGTASLGPVLLQIQTEQARRAGVRQTESLIAQNVDGILVVDERECILFANPAAEEAFGWKAEELKGMPFGTPTVHSDVAELEIRNARTGKVRVNEMRVAAIDWEGRPARLVSLRDVTEQSEARKALEHHEAALRGRVKELRCLYAVSGYLARNDIDWKRILALIVQAICDGWRHPDTVCARLTVEGVEVVSANFQETQWRLRDDIAIDEESLGRLEVFYLEERRRRDIGPFLLEERNMLRDIGRRIGQAVSARRHQQELQGSRRRFQDFAEAASDWLWEMDENLRFTYFSDRIQDVMGQPLAHWVGRSRWELTEENARRDPKWLHHMADLDARRPFKDFRYELKLPDGSNRHIAISGIPVFDADGVFRGYRGTGTDETQEVNALHQALESDRRLHNIADRLPGIVFQRLRKADGTIEYPYLSGGTVDQLGYTIEEIQADPLMWAGCMHPEDQPRFHVAVTESSQTLEPMDIKFRMSTRSGEERWFWHRSRPQRLGEGDTLWDCIELDITEQKKTEARLQHLGFHDQLTGLPNRDLFVERVNQILPITSRNRQSLAVAMLGLKRFKQVNEEFGMSGGDEVLRAAATRFAECLRPGDTVARLGGDRFLFLLPSVGSDPQSHKPLDRLLKAMDEPFLVRQKPILLTFNMGIALFPDDADNVEALIQKADTAQAHFSRWGPGFGYAFYRDKMPAPGTPRLALEMELRQAIELGDAQLKAFFQPIFDAATGRLIAVETLARWMHPQRGLVPPTEFIFLAEETGLINPLGMEILRQACTHIRQWEEAGFPRVDVTVNVSARQIRSLDLAASVREVLAETGMPPDRLVLEITESTLVDDLDLATEFIEELVAVGVRFALDDFGVGYSSLSYLSRLPVHTLKIDRSFIRDLHEDPRSETTITAIVALAHALKLHVVAEGIETAEQMEHVKRLGCDTLQGFWLGRPMPPGELRSLLGPCDASRPPGDHPADPTNRR